MQAQQLQAKKRNGGSLLRLVLWLLAAVSLGDVVPAAGEFLRTAGARAAADGCACTFDLLARGSGGQQIMVADENRPLPAGLPGSESAVDGDEGRNPVEFLHHGRTPAPHGIAAGQLPDGQPFTAFNSRAPPRSA